MNIVQRFFQHRRQRQEDEARLKRFLEWRDSVWREEWRRGLREGSTNMDWPNYRTTRLIEKLLVGHEATTDD